MDREEILAAAAEIGVGVRAVDQAIAAVEHQRELERELADLDAKRRRSFAASLKAWAAVNTGLFLLNWLNEPGNWWFQWPLLIWGAFLALQARKTFLPDRRADREKAQQNVERRQQKLEAERRKLERERLKRRLATAVTDGLQALLGEEGDRRDPARERTSQKGERAAGRVRVPEEAQAEDSPDVETPEQRRRGRS